MKRAPRRAAYAPRGGDGGPSSYLFWLACSEWGSWTGNTCRLCSFPVELVARGSGVSPVNMGWGEGSAVTGPQWAAGTCLGLSLGMTSHLEVSLPFIFPIGICHIQSRALQFYLLLFAVLQIWLEAAYFQSLGTSGREQCRKPPANMNPSPGLGI